MSESAELVGCYMKLEKSDKFYDLVGLKWKKMKQLQYSLYIFLRVW